MPPRLSPPHLRRLSAAAAQSHSPAPSHAPPSAPPSPPHPAPRPLHPALRSKRRLAASPLLPPEAVAVAPGVQAHIERAAHAARASPRLLRRAARVFERAERAGAAKAGPHAPRARGAPTVPHVADYGDEGVALAGVVTGSAQSLAACTHVAAELRRLREGFCPRSVLDFGAGGAFAVSAVGRVFREGGEGAAVGGEDGDGGDSAAQRDAQVLVASHRGGESFGRSKGDWSSDGNTTTLKEALLVDRSEVMQRLGTGLLRADQYLAGMKTSVAGRLSAVSRRAQFDVVSASYSLSEVVREALSQGGEAEDVAGNGNAAALGDNESARRSRPSREALAEKRLRGIVKDLWRRVAPGGVLVIVEHGTLAGFETVLFARHAILNGKWRPEAVSEEAGDDKVQDEEVTGPDPLKPRVLAPCLHSKACPLEGNATRARVCRFSQRFNRPLYLRTTRGGTKGFEDTRFSYVVIERPRAGAEANAVDASEGYWGRLVRQPLRRGKHVVLDACTGEGTLERRVSSKKNAEPGMYHIARKVRWGDVWPLPAPASKTQPVTF